MRPGNFLRFLFSTSDQARIDAASVQVADVPYNAAPTANQHYPQAMRLTFRITNPANGPVQIRPLFPGNVTFVPDETAPGVTPDPASVDFTDSAYATWKTLGTVMIKPTANHGLPEGIDALAPGLEVKPNISWYSRVRISKEFLFNTLRSGLTKIDISAGLPGRSTIKSTDPDWEKYAVAHFLAGQYAPTLRLGTSVELDDVQVHPMPTVEMAGDGTVSLVITMARTTVPQDGLEQEFDTLAGTTPRTNPAHPRNGAIPARHVYRSFRSVMIDAAEFLPVPNAILADWPAAPRYFPLRFTRTWQPIENCSVYFPTQSVHIQDVAGKLIHQRLPAHGLLYLAQEPTSPEPAPPDVVVSVAPRPDLLAGEEMRYLDGATPPTPPGTPPPPLRWRVKADVTPLAYNFASVAAPHIILRRRMSNEMLVESRPAPRGTRCTYLSLRRSVRALINNRIVGGRLNFRPNRTGPLTLRLMNEAWQNTNTGASADLVRNNRPSTGADPGIARTHLQPILRAFFPEALPLPSANCPQSGFCDKGQMMYHLWQTIIGSFQQPATRPNFSDDYIGRGGSGALVSVGLAAGFRVDPTRNNGESEAEYFDRIVGEMLTGLEPGAVLQFWNLNSDYEAIKDCQDHPIPGGSLPLPVSVHYGHSPIFLEYMGPAGAPTGIKVIDQFRETECPVTGTAAARNRRLAWGGGDPEEIWIAANWEE